MSTETLETWTGSATIFTDGATTSAPRPAGYNADVVLRGGSTVRVRPVRPDDASRLYEFLRALSAQSRALRFFAAMGDEALRREATRETQPDGALGFGLIATLGDEEHIVGHAEYVVARADHAEVGFAIADECQGQGLGTILLGQLAQVASSRGIRVFEAVVLPENHQMLTMFRESGFAVRVHAAPGEIRVEFPTELTAEALERFEDRDWTAAVNAMRAFFLPRSVAVIGASRRRGTIGGEILHNLLSYGFQGPVLPVNPSAPVVQSVVAYESVEAVPGAVDLAVVPVPAERVLDVAAACGRKGVRAIVDGARSFAGAKPVLSVFMQSRGGPDELRAADVSIPSYAFPEDAAIALARAARYGEWRARPLVAPAHFADARRDEAAAIVAAALGRGAGWLTPAEVWALLSCYGLPVLDQRLAPTAEEAARAAAELGGPVALKAVAPGLVHKSDAGAVRLNLSADEIARAACEMVERLAAAGAAPSGFLVQRMAPRGVEMIVGVVHDSQFGPVVACGAGGVLVELLKDVSVRLAPLAAPDAAEMVRELRTYPLLTGYRGGPAHDVGALEEAILRVGAMVEELPQIAELDLNPIVVYPHGVAVVDARIRVAPAEPSPLVGARG